MSCAEATVRSHRQEHPFHVKRPDERRPQWSILPSQRRRRSDSMCCQSAEAVSAGRRGLARHAALLHVKRLPTQPNGDVARILSQDVGILEPAAPRPRRSGPHARTETWHDSKNLQNGDSLQRPPRRLGPDGNQRRRVSRETPRQRRTEPTERARGRAGKCSCAPTARLLSTEHTCHPAPPRTVRAGWTPT